MVDKNKNNKLDKIDDDFFLDEDDFGNNVNINDNNDQEEIFQDPEYNENNGDNDGEANNDMDEYTVRIFGLDNAGKSTLMMNLINPKEGNVAEITEDFNADTFVYNNAKINFWDIAGRKDNREYWKSYFHSSDGFIYVVDISDTGRLNEAKTTLHSLILTEDNEGIPLLIYANKADKLSKMLDKNEVLNLLGVKSSDNVAVQVCSAKTFKGLVEGFDWLFNKIKL